MARRDRGSLMTVPRVVAVATLLVGFVFALLTPPLAGFDEAAHFLRAYEVSSGHLIPHRNVVDAGFGEFPKQLVIDIRRTTSDLLLPGHDRTAFLGHLGDDAPNGPSERVRIGAIAGYGPVAYLPAAAAIRFGRITGASTLVLMYLGRLANLIVYAFLVTLAVARARRAKWLLACAALIPTALAGATTVTIDGVTYALILLLLAMTIRGWSTTDRWRTTDTVVACVTACALGLAKPPYAVFALLLLPRIIASRGVRRFAFTIATVAPIAAMVGWAAWMERPLSSQDVSFGAIVSTDRFHPYTHIDSARQMSRNIVRDPVGFLEVLGRTISRFGAGWLRDAPAQLKIATTNTLGVAILAWSALAIAAFVSRGALDGIDSALATGAVPMTSGEHPARPRRVWLALLGVLVTIATLAGAYVGWNALGSPAIYAYQGRYLVAVCVLVVLALMPTRSLTRQDTVGGMAIAVMLAALTWYGALIVQAFY